MVSWRPGNVVYENPKHLEARWSLHLFNSPLIPTADFGEARGRAFSREAQRGPVGSTEALPALFQTIGFYQKHWDGNLNRSLFCPILQGRASTCLLLYREVPEGAAHTCEFVL